MHPRRFLVWCSANGGNVKAELYNPLRNFDVALHDYGPWKPTSRGPDIMEPEYWIPSEGTEKLETAGANLLSLPAYEGYAFLDDDLEISTLEINALFAHQNQHQFDIVQPALTPDSVGSWAHTFMDVDSLLPCRPVPFVEVMAPFFTAHALQQCYWSFSLNQSGWGLDCEIWPKLCSTFVCDNIRMKHAGPFRPFAKRVMRNGLSAWQELDIIKKIRYDGDEHQW